MDPAEKCFFCGRTSSEAELVAWFVPDERRTTHSACWLEAYRSQALAPDQAPEKTLDDIRRELEAEYLAQSGAAEMGVPVARDEEARIIEHHRSASRRRRRRRHAMAALGTIAGSVLLVVSYVAVTRGTIPRGAFASALDATASKAAAAGTANAERPSPNTSAAPPAAALITELDQQVKALRRDLQALATSLEGADSRIAGMESRVSGVESSMRRFADEAAAIRAGERPVAAPRRAAERPAAAPRQTVPPAPASVTVVHPQRWTPARHSTNGSSSASDVRPVAETVASPERQTASTTTPGVAPTRGGSAVSDNASRSSMPPTFGEKLRADWRAIKQGFASAGDELKTSMRDVTRKITRD